MATYAKLLQHPQWQKKRLEIMSRDNFVCLFCLDTESPLHVHHDYYIPRRKPWQYPDSALLTLCDACHELVHNHTMDKTELKVLLMDRHGCGTLTDAALTYLFPKHNLAGL